MPCCVFLVAEDLSSFVSDDAVAVPALEALGWSVQFVPWRSLHRWADTDLVVIRATWDYHRDLEAFEAALHRIAAQAPLENRLSMVRWNARKTYLRDLDARGVPVVATAWSDAGLPADFDALAASLGSDDVVVKPVVGANAEDAFRLGPRTGAAEVAHARTRLAGRACMIQPYLDRITEHGEISIVFIDGHVSHAVRKLPAAGDFRSQEEHGATVTAVVPDTAMVDVARRAVACAGAPTLYGRVDLVVDAHDVPRVMELELVEPSLYLRMDAEAPGRLARAIAARVPGNGRTRPPG